MEHIEVIMNTKVSLKLLKRNEYYSVFLICLVYFGMFFFMFINKKADLTESIQHAVIMSSLNTLVLAVSLSLLFFIIDKNISPNFAWEINEHEIYYSMKSAVKEKISVNEIKAVKFDHINGRLERGIKVVSKSGKSIFIPQNTDRFYEAALILRNLKQAS
jgi:hypothetical protein